MKNKIIFLCSFMAVIWLATQFLGGDGKPAERLQFLSDGFSTAANVKIRVAEYYHAQGEFPTSNEQLGLPAPQLFASRALDSLAVKEGGVIELKFNALTGVETGIVRLMPEGDFKLSNFKCVTPSYQTIQRFYQYCNYLPDVSEKTSTAVVTIDAPKIELTEKQKIINLSVGFKVAEPIKFEVEKFQSVNAYFPRSNQELCIDEPKAYIRHSLKRLTILDKGVIELIFNSSTGLDEGKVLLTPGIEESRFVWQCTTNDYTWIAEVDEICE